MGSNTKNHVNGEEKLSQVGKPEFVEPQLTQLGNLREMTAQQGPPFSDG